MRIRNSYSNKIDDISRDWILQGIRNSLAPISTKVIGNYQCSLAISVGNGDPCLLFAVEYVSFNRYDLKSRDIDVLTDMLVKLIKRLYIIDGNRINIKIVGRLL